MKLSTIGFLTLSISLTLMTLSLAGCGGSSDASTHRGAGQGPGGGRGRGQANLTALSGGCQGCPAQGACAQKNSGCGESGDSCSKSQCPGQGKNCGSGDGQCGGCEKGGCVGERECGGCSGHSGACDAQKCLECPQAGHCDKIDLTGFGVTDTIVPPLPQSPK